MSGKGPGWRKDVDFKKYYINLAEIDWRRKSKDSSPRKKKDKKSPSQ